MLGKPATGFAACALGVVSEAEFDNQSDHCPSPGNKVWYSRIFGKISWLEARFAGGCYHGSSNGYQYVRCW